MQARGYVISDVESVLIDGEFLPALAELTGRGAEVAVITREGIEGRINWEEGLRRRIEILKGVSYEDCMRALKKMKLMPGAHEFVNGAHRLGFKVIAVSGGFTLFRHLLEDTLGVDYFFANRLIFTGNRLAGCDIQVNDHKELALFRGVDPRFRQKPKLTIADGKNDIHMLALGDLKIAFNSSILGPYADFDIKSKDLGDAAKLMRRWAHNKFTVPATR